MAETTSGNRSTCVANTAPSVYFRIPYNDVGVNSSFVHVWSECRAASQIIFFSFDPAPCNFSSSTLNIHVGLSHYYIMCVCLIVCQEYDACRD